MGNLSNILGGPWSPPEPDPPEIQVKRSMELEGLNPPSIIMDGNIHRFSTGPHKTDDAGWYVFYNDNIPAGRFGDWRTGLDVPWRAQLSRPLTGAEQLAYQRRIQEASKQRDETKRRLQESVCDVVSTIWSDAGSSSPDHPYLKKKGIKPNGSRVTGDGRLMVPLFSQNGELSSLQYIGFDGDKKYHSGGVVRGCFHILGDIERSDTVYIAEGFATGATIYEETGKPVFIAYSAGNIVDVTKFVRSKHETVSIVIVADNDISGTGKNYAEQAAALYGASVIIPPDVGDINDYRQSGGNVVELLVPTFDDWLIHADTFCENQTHVSWLVKHWLQKEALIMVHGPSGSGKTFLVLDWCLHISTEKDQWIGSVVKSGPVVYLAGEGHHGLRSRIKAWKQFHKVDKTKLYLSRSGIDLNTLEGTQKVIDNIRNLLEKPKLIVVDTLHRFLLGDENKAQDAKVMIDACVKIMHEFNCSVLLVHHTGVSDEAQHRARGSSAWKGALDIEISVKPNNGSIQVRQMKSKDSEQAADIWGDLQKVPIEGWFDDEGEQVVSALFVEGTIPVSARKTDSAMEKAKGTFIDIWDKTGNEWYNEKPYITRSAHDEYYRKEGLKEDAIRQKWSRFKKSLGNTFVEEQDWIVMVNDWILDQIAQFIDNKL